MSRSDVFFAPARLRIQASSFRGHLRLSIRRGDYSILEVENVIMDGYYIFFGSSHVTLLRL